MSRNRRNRNRATATQIRAAQTLQPAQTYNGENWVYLLASRVNPTLCKIGSGNPAERCARWSAQEPGGLYIFAAYEYPTRDAAYRAERLAQQAYAGWNRNPDPTQGDQEFFLITPAQAQRYFDAAHPVALAAERTTDAAQAQQRATDAAQAEIQRLTDATNRAMERAALAQQRAAELEQRAAMMDGTLDALARIAKSGDAWLDGKREHAPDPREAPIRNALLEGFAAMMNYEKIQGVLRQAEERRADAERSYGELQQYNEELHNTLCRTETRLYDLKQRNARTRTRIAEVLENSLGPTLARTIADRCARADRRFRSLFA